MVLANLSASTQFLPASPQKFAPFCAYKETDSLCSTQSVIDEAKILSDSATSTCSGKPLAGMYQPSFSASTRDLLGLPLVRSDSELGGEDL